MTNHAREANQAITRDLVLAIDLRLQSVHSIDETSRNEFLAAHISEVGPQKQVGGPHSVESLTAKLKYVATRQAAVTGEWLRIWSLGSRMMKPVYWNQIRLIQSGATRVLPATTSTHVPNPSLPEVARTGTSPNRPRDDSSASKGIADTNVRRRIDADPSGSHGVQELKVTDQAEENTGREAPLNPSMPVSTYDTVDQNVALPISANLKRKAEEQLTPIKQPAQKCSKGLLGSDMPSVDSGSMLVPQDAERVIGAELEIDQPNEETLTQLPQLAAESPGHGRLPTVSDMNAGRSKKPIEGVRGRLSAVHLDRAEITRTMEQLWPPEDHTAGTTNARSLERSTALTQLKVMMENLGQEVIRIPQDFIFANKLSLNTPAKLVSKPMPALDALYRKITGTTQWQKKWFECRHKDKPVFIGNNVVISSLIAASIHSEVFCKTPPWDIERRMYTESGSDIVFDERSMDDKGHELSEFLKQWSYKMYCDEGYQSTTIRPYAGALAATLAEVLMPHMALARQSEKLDEDSASMKISDWFHSLEKLFFAAVMLKGKARTYDEVNFEYTWCSSGSPLDRSKATPLYEGTGAEQEVLLTVWPGMKPTTKSDATHVSRTMQHVSAVVLAKNMKESEETDQP